MSETITLDEIDEELGMLRDAWMKSDAAKKAGWMRQIDKKLDERNALTKGGKLTTTTTNAKTE